MNTANVRGPCSQQLNVIASTEEKLDQPLIEILDNKGRALSR